MNSRRDFLRKSGIVTVLALAVPGIAKGMMGERISDGELTRILPKRLKKGDMIGLVTPGSPVTKEQLEGAVEKLESLGFRTTYNESVMSEYGYFAGKDQERADELMEMFNRDDIDGIWCVRGGYGSIRILDLLDYELIKNNPKVFIGYSDITAIINAIYEQAGLITFHGPVGISNFNRFSIRSIEKVLMTPKESYKYPYRREKETKDNPEFDRYTIRGGVAEGILAGGNISVLDSMIGSKFEVDFKDKIVFLEEIEEKTYRVDKMVYHLISGSNLSEAKGIVMGAMGDCNINDEPRLTLKTALDDLLKPLGIPVAYGLSYGHISRMVTIPAGIRARFNADNCSLELLEAAVI